MLNSLLNLNMPHGDPDPITPIGLGKSIAMMSRQRTPFDDTADIRDSLTALVGKGYTGVSDDDARGHFGRLTSILGRDAAQKLMTHIFIYNQTPTARGVGLQEKINQFYNIGSRDSSINDILSRVNKFGSGVQSGLTDSPEIQNQELSNRYVAKK